MIILGRDCGGYKETVVVVMGEEVERGKVARNGRERLGGEK